jgi:hypothetical protein
MRQPVRVATETHAGENEWSALGTVFLAGCLGLAIGGGAMWIATQSILNFIHIPGPQSQRRFSDAETVEPDLATLAEADDVRGQTNPFGKPPGEEW